MGKSKPVTWKFRARTNTWEATVKGDDKPLLFICGRLCVTDLRESRASKTWKSPKHYSIKGLELNEAKQLAEDLVVGANFEKHEANRLAVEAENNRVVKVIEHAEAFIKSLQKK